MSEQEWALHQQTRDLEREVAYYREKASYFEATLQAIARAHSDSAMRIADGALKRYEMLEEASDA